MWWENVHKQEVWPQSQKSIQEPGRESRRVTGSVHWKSPRTGIFKRQKSDCCTTPEQETTSEVRYVG